MLARLTVICAVATVAVLMTGCPEVGPRGPDAQVADASVAELVVPAQGAAAPTNLNRVVVAGAGAVALPGVPTQPLMVQSCGADVCAGAQLLAPLAPQTTYTVQAGTFVLSFTTGDGPDHTPPQLLATSRFEGRCVTAHLSADEPITAWLHDANGSELSRSDVAQLAHELVVRTTEPRVLAGAIDSAGNLSAQWLPVDGRDSALVVSEVLAHPLGPQPAQEWVELHNVSGQTVSTAGLAIAAGASSDPLPEALVPAGGYAVIVPAGWRSDGPDVAPAASAAIVRLASTTIGSGLANGGGSPVELRDGAGHVLSRYGGWIDVSAHSKAGTSAARVADDACDAPAAWRAAPQPTPGAPN